MWNSIVSELKKTENENLIKAFIYPMVPIKESKEEIVIGCPSQAIIQILEKNNFIVKIDNIAKELFNHDTTVKFIIKSMEQIEGIQPILPITENISIKKSKSTLLQGDYTFNNFVSGPSNQTVFAASMSIAKNPGSDYNPLFIYGDTGLGKTHIMQAIGNYLNEKGKSVCYITTQQFINEFIKALETKKVSSLASKLLSYNIILVDDIQYLSRTDVTQDFFFEIFNEFHLKKKQIVITADKYPVEIRNLQERLKSRFSWGVTLEMKPPELETRIAIVQKKSQLYNINIDGEVIMFIAKNIKSNVREIEGALKKLQISAEVIDKKKIDTSFAESILGDVIKSKKKVSVDDIIKMVSSYMRIKVADVISEKRSKQISMCRQIAIYLSKKYTDGTLQEIGTKMGGRNHSTIISSISKVERMIMDDINTKKLVEKFVKELEDNKL